MKVWELFFFFAVVRVNLEDVGELWKDDSTRGCFIWRMTRSNSFQFYGWSEKEIVLAEFLFIKGNLLSICNLQLGKIAASIISITMDKAKIPSLDSR